MFVFVEAFQLKNAVAQINITFHVPTLKAWGQKRQGWSQSGYVAGQKD